MPFRAWTFPRGRGGEMSDHGLKGGASFELALDLRRDAPLVAGRMDLELVIEWGIVALWPR